MIVQTLPSVLSDRDYLHQFYEVADIDPTVKIYILNGGRIDFRCDILHKTHEVERINAAVAVNIAVVFSDKVYIAIDGRCSVNGIEKVFSPDVASQYIEPYSKPATLYIPGSPTCMRLYGRVSI